MNMKIPLHKLLDKAFGVNRVKNRENINKLLAELDENPDQVVIPMSK